VREYSQFIYAGPNSAAEIVNNPWLDLNNRIEPSLAGCPSRETGRKCSAEYMLAIFPLRHPALASFLWAIRVI
jgi:hypothetical protein